MCQITQEVIHGELEGLRGILVLLCQAGPPLAPGATLLRASFPVVSSAGCRSLWLFPHQSAAWARVSGPAGHGGWMEGDHCFGLLRASLHFLSVLTQDLTGSQELFFLSFPC